MRKELNPFISWSNESHRSVGPMLSVQVFAS